MYEVKICIVTDGDFGYEDPEFKIEDEEELVFYFADRKKAAEAIVRSFHNLKNSFRTTKNLDCIKSWIDNWNEKIELLAKKLPTFVISEDFGNQQISYSLLWTRKATLGNGSYTYCNENPKFEFGSVDDVKWDAVVNLENYKE